MNMAAMIGANMKRKEIEAGAEFFHAMLGLDYDISECQQMMDYGFYPEIKASEWPAIRENQYAMLIGLMAQEYGADWGEMLSECFDASLIRAKIFSGELDAFIYEGQQ